MKPESEKEPLPQIDWSNSQDHLPRGSTLRRLRARGKLRATQGINPDASIHRHDETTDRELDDKATEQHSQSANQQSQVIGEENSDGINITELEDEAGETRPLTPSVSPARQDADSAWWEMRRQAEIHELELIAMEEQSRRAHETHAQRMLRELEEEKRELERWRDERKRNEHENRIDQQHRYHAKSVHLDIDDDDERAEELRQQLRQDDLKEEQRLILEEHLERLEEQRERERQLDQEEREREEYQRQLDQDRVDR